LYCDWSILPICQFYQILGTSPQPIDGTDEQYCIFVGGRQCAGFASLTLFYHIEWNTLHVFEVGPMLQNILIILLPILLTGCKENLTYPYLMQHPQVLKNAVENCQATKEKSKEEASQCEIVMNAATNLMSVMNEMQENPEQFGQRVMDAENAYVKAKNELYLAQQELADLQKKQATPAGLKAAQDKIDNAKKGYEGKREEVKVMLAVIGINSPE